MISTNKIYHLFICILLFSSSSLGLFAQDFQTNGISLPPNFSPSIIGGMDQDELGNIWLATLNQGLFKYNGTSFTSYSSDKKNDESLVSDRLECLYVAKDGRVWVGSFSSGISVLDPRSEKFVNYVHDENDETSIRSNSIRTFAEDAEGGIWIATNHGLDYWNPKTNAFENNLQENTDGQLLNKEHIRVLYFDNAGTLWAGASSPFIGEQTEGGLFKIHTKTGTVKRYISSDDPQSLENNIVTAIAEDSRGNFWVGTAGDGLHTMDRELGTFEKHSYDPSDPTKLSRPAIETEYDYANDHIRFIEEDSNGRLWIGTMSNGINLYDPELHTTTHLTDGIGPMPVNEWWGALRSDDGLMWLASWEAGGNDENQVLFKVDQNPIEFNIYETNGPIYSFGGGYDGMIYTGYSSVLYQYYDDENRTDRNLKIEEEVEVEFYHFNTKGRQNVWVATNLGLLHTDKDLTSYEIFPIYDEKLELGKRLEVNMTASISPDSLLVATSNGLFLFDSHSKDFQLIDLEYDQKAPRSATRVNELLIDSEGLIWVGFQTYGLKRLSPDLSGFKDYGFVENIQDGVLAIHEDNSGHLFIGTRRSGLRKYNRHDDVFDLVIDKFEILESDGLIGGIISIDENTLWVTTLNNLVSLNLLDSSSQVINLETQGEREYTSLRFFSTDRGHHFVGAEDALIRYRPESFINRLDIKKPPVISNVSVENVSVLSDIIDNNLTTPLKYDQNNISFKINNIDYRNSSFAKLVYKLDDYDSEWRMGQNDEKVFYYHLPAGSYTFKLRLEGSKDEKVETSVSFRILPPWWKTWWAYLLYALSIGVGIWYFNKSQRERTIRVEREKTRERELAQAKEIEKAYTELKATQEQLIHSEKMASLGELTAGIAHEIQNPLNFVNNFSEVSAELLDEMLEEVANGDLEEVKEITTDLKQNLKKIVHHGKRADSIVKGMLLHSRSNTVEKVATDINALADEYLRLSFHGLRAKDRTFNAEMKTDFDYKLPKIDIAPQEMGRVLLNLITNAFHAVHEKKQATEEPYDPLVKLRSYDEDDRLLLSIKDNGNGIPEAIKSKIFQPFFTTKAAGQGTGLGLSISYDIIKSMGGEILVNSQEGEGTEFVISLPLNYN